MSDIKKKFLDILFEPEDEDVKVDAPLQEIEKEPKIEVETKNNTKSPNVKDVLYGKQEKPSSFIDYFEVPRKEKPVEIEEETYEMRENVSPIFGLIAKKEDKKVLANEKDIQKAVSVSSDFNGAVISPIYGYDEGKANDARKNLAGTHVKEIKEKIEEEIVLNEEDVPFEIPEDITETIKEAVQESVVELNQNMYVNKEDSISFEENKVDDSSEELFEETEEVQTEETKAEEEIQKECEEVMDDYAFDEPVVDNVDESETFNEPFATTEELNIIENEGEDNKDKPLNDPPKKSTKKKQKANRSIYDTTPIQLFDFDDIIDKDNEKDLFDELIGDDD